MIIICVEDDHLQFDSISKKIRQAFPGVTIEGIKTEKDFRDKMADFARKPPDVFIIDVMLRWTDPSPKMELAPKEVAEGGFFKAGLRCLQRLVSQEETKNIPVIFYTVLEKNNLEEDLKHIYGKFDFLEKDSDLSSLIQLIRKIKDDYKSIIK